MLELSGVSYAYGGVTALRDVSLTVGEREIVALVGANGAGKSTLVHVLSGVLQPDGGSVRWKGRDLTRLDARDIVRAGVVQVPEGRHLFAGQDVEVNLKLGAYAKRSARRRTEELLAGVYDLFPQLAERRRQVTGTLSGGEQQMVAIGRALMSQPELIALDEPTMGLAPLVADRIWEKLLDLNRHGVALVIVEQNARWALELAQRGYVLETGRIVMSGPAQDLLHEPRVQTAYLGAHVGPEDVDAQG